MRNTAGKTVACRIGIFILALAAPANLFAAASDNEAATRAAQYLQSGNYQSACATLRPATAEHPNSSELWNMLGICEAELHRTIAATKAFESGLRIAPRSASLHENLGGLFFREGDYANAKTQLQLALSLGSTNPGTAFSLAASKIRTGEERAGLAELDHLESALSNQAAYWTERGWVEMRVRPASAAASFDHALALAPDDLRALNGAASVAEAEHNNEKAISLLLQAKRSNPDDVTTLLHLGSLCLKQDLTVDAMDVLKHAYQLAPSNNLALFLYARANIAIQHWQESYDLFKEFDRRVPNYAPAQFALGWLDLKLNRTDAARAHLERTLVLDPGQQQARCELAELNLNQDRLVEARHELRTVLSKEPRNAKANVAMGDLLMKDGNFQEAKQHYEKAIASDPGSGSAHYKLSTALMRLHETDEADRERALGAKLNADAEKTSRTVLVLTDPDGKLLTGAPHPLGGGAQ